MTKPGVAIVIPAYNESRHIESVVRGVKDLSDVIIVVDDGSSDRTGDISEQAGAVVISNQGNMGYDYSVLNGLSYCFKEEYDIVVTMDADGQHKAEDVRAVVNKLISGSYLVVGNRRIFQRFSEKLFGLLCRLRFGVSDPFCGLKGYRNCEVYSSKIVNSVKFNSVGTRLMFLYLLSGIKAEQIDIISPPREGQSRFGGGFRTELLLIKTIFHSIRFYFFPRKK